MVVSAYFSIPIQSHKNQVLTGSAGWGGIILAPAGWHIQEIPLGRLMG
jgi:hypothetical protein